MVVFQVGDVVQLKSGGPAMTVFSMAAQEENLVVLSCQWQSSRGELRYDYFYPEILRPYRQPERRNVAKADNSEGRW